MGERILKIAAFATMFLIIFSFSSCKKNICEACTWEGFDTNGDPVGETLRDCTAPGREINRQRCEEQALNYSGTCNCVEED